MATPKLLICIIGPLDIASKTSILDIGAEANVMLYKLAKSLGCLILSIENLKLKTMSRQVL